MKRIRLLLRDYMYIIVLRMTGVIPLVPIFTSNQSRLKGGGKSGNCPINYLRKFLFTIYITNFLNCIFLYIPYSYILSILIKK